MSFIYQIKAVAHFQIIRKLKIGTLSNKSWIAARLFHLGWISEWFRRSEQLNFPFESRRWNWNMLLHLSVCVCVWEREREIFTAEHKKWAVKSPLFFSTESLKVKTGSPWALSILKDYIYFCLFLKGHWFPDVRNYTV